MIQDQIQNHLDIPLMTQLKEFYKILLRTEGTVNFVIVNDIIFVIGRRRKDRCQPDSLNSKAFPRINIPII